MEEDDDRQQKLYAPLKMIHDAANSMLDRRTPLSRERVDSLYRHIAGAMGEMLDGTRKQIDDSLASVREAGAALTEQEPDYAPVFQLFDEGREQIQAGLTLMAQTFFSSADVTALERNQGALALAESQIQGGLSRIESALLLADDPNLLASPLVPTAPEIPTALDSLGVCLEVLGRYLEKGERAELEEALTHLDQARELILRALGG
ncbi:MAG: hypothetical protein AB1758_25685 [Candidatus Eremiobacterota bacterium]